MAEVTPASHHHRLASMGIAHLGHALLCVPSSVCAAAGAASGYAYELLGEGWTTNAVMFEALFEAPVL